MNDGRFHKYGNAGTEALDLVAEWTDEFPRYYAEVDLPPTGPPPDERQAVALEKIALLLETIADRLAPTADPAPQSDTDGWIDWHGGECPISPLTTVDIRYRDGVPGRDGLTPSGGLASDYSWEHYQSP